METTIKGLAAKLDQVQQKRKLLVDQARKVEDELKEAFGDTEIYANSSDVNLEQIGYDDYAYGHLSYDRTTGLTVAYRTTDDDYYEDFHETPEWGRTYNVKAFAICSPTWLEKLFVEQTLSSLLANLSTKIDEMGGRADQSLGALEKILAAESSEIDGQMVQLLKQSGGDGLSKSWSATLAAVDLDTADSLTRSSSFLESVCIKILKDREVDLPHTKTMANLVDSCLKCLEWPTTIEAEDVKKITGGLKSIALGISSLRTHFGTAHGSTGEHGPIDASYAKLSKNTCASVAVFLLSRHVKGSN
jgi:Abortive infection C-terminus